MRILFLSLIAIGILVGYMLFDKNKIDKPDIPTDKIITIECNMTQILEDSISLPHQINLPNGERLTLTKINHINFEQTTAVITYSAEFNKNTILFPIEISFYVNGNKNLKIAGIKLNLPEALKVHENYISTKLENVLKLKDIDLPPNAVGLEKIQADKLILRQSY